MAVFIAIAVGIVVLPVIAFAMLERVRSRKQRAALLALTPEAVSKGAATEVVAARAAFAAAVDRYEVAVAVAAPVATIAISGTGEVGIESTMSGVSDTQSAAIQTMVESSEIAELEREKDRARQQLIDAQNRWEGTRPAADADASVQLWSGFGVLRGWQLGFVGFERAFIRCEHVIDPTCWAAWEVSRFRFGLALGAETQRLALFGAAVPTNRIGEVVGRAMGGAEAAIRPGFAPMRWWRRRGRTEQPRLATDALLAQDGVEQHEFAGTRTAVDAAFEYELAEPVESVDSLGDADGVLSVLTAGPSMVIGAWGGAEPKANLLAASDHIAWRTKP